MYNEQLEKFIEMALIDGVLTDKERTVLLNKAEEFGVDLDEFEMVLDARLFERQQNKTVAPKSDKLGEIKKCPACGAIIESFSSSCNACGYEFRNVGVNNSVKLLSEKLDNVILECDEKERNREYNVNGGLSALTETQEQVIQKKEEDILTKQRYIIKNFPIPNTREDILELLHFIRPKAKYSFSADKNVNEWRNKFSEILVRAKIAFKGDTKMLSEIAEYEKSMQGSFVMKAISSFNGLPKRTKKTVLAFSAVGIFIICMIPFFSGMSGKHDKGVEKEKQRLDSVLKLVNDAMNLKDYDKALLLTAQLHWEYIDDYSTDDTKKLEQTWSEKKDEITNQINEQLGKAGKHHSRKRN